MQRINNSVNLVLLKTTFSSKDEARKTSEILFEKKLVSYTHIYQIESMTRDLQDRVLRKDEFLLEIITIESNLLEIKRIIWEIAKYIVPEDIHHIAIGENKFLTKVCSDCAIKIM